MQAEDLYLSAGNQTIFGWTDVRVTRGIERCVSDFEIGLTEKISDTSGEVWVQPGDECQVQFGTDLVLTGYVDHYIPSISPNEHTVRIAGRGKCGDLVDCAADWPNSQISGTSAADIATKLAAPYGVSVKCDVSDLVKIPQFNIFVGETPFEVIERVSRFSQLLVYDEPDGNLRLARANKQMEAAGGLVQGFNVQSASILYSSADRFRDYVCFAQSILSFSDAGIGPNALASATDPVVKRPRKHFIVAEAMQGFPDLVRKRANWEMQRRAGRAAVVTVRTDSWRDASGSLWTPNTLVYVELPALKLPAATWLIAEVTYRRTLQEGTTCDLVIMHPDAFQPEPIALLPTFVDSNTL